jgi:hypothetical protein
MSATLSPRIDLPFAVEDTALSAPATLAVRRVRWSGRIIAVLLCLLHVYTSRHAINPDGISYLDVASAYARGDLGGAVNYYWSPLYSWLLAGMSLLVPAGAYWDAGVAHLTNFVTFVLSLLAFEWLVSEVLRTRRFQREELADRGRELLPDWVVVAVGYACFIWVARWLVPLSKLTPDALVAATVYAGVAVLLRLRREPQCTWAAPVLGALLGLGYLAKAVVLPLSLLFLGGLVLTVRWPRALRLALVVGGVLALIAGPYVGFLSWGKGRLTIGETGRLNHLWYVGKEQRPVEFGMSANVPAGVERVLAAPPVVAFGRAGAGSFPLWYDPSFYYEGKSAPTNLGLQVTASLGAARGFAWMLPTQLLAPTCAVLGVTALGLFAGWPRGSAAERGSGSGGWLGEWVRGLFRWSSVLLVGVGALSLYVLMGIAEPRLGGPFLLLVLFGLVVGLSVPRGGWLTIRRPAGLLLEVLAVVVLVALLVDGQAAGQVSRQGEGPGANPHWAVAEALRELGVQPGEGVASIGDKDQYYWARVGGFQVVALVPKGAALDFEKASLEERADVYTACATARARALVARTLPDGEPGWRRVAGTDYSVRLLTGRN